MARFLQDVSTLYTSHGIHSSNTSIEACVASLEETTAYFEKAIEEEEKYSGVRKTIERAHGVLSSETIGSVRMTLEALKKSKKHVLSVNSSYVAQSFSSH